MPGYFVCGSFCAAWRRTKDGSRHRYLSLLYVVLVAAVVLVWTDRKKFVRVTNWPLVAPHPSQLRR